MPVRKMIDDGDSVRVTIPKRDLRERGFINDEGKLREEKFAKVVATDDGKGWNITPLDV